MLQRSSQKYILHDLHQNMYGGSWIIPDFCWFLYPLIWRNIDVGFNGFCIIFLVYMMSPSGWYMISPYHIWEQIMQVLLGNSYNHSRTWKVIEDHSLFWQWCERGHHTGDWGNPMWVLSCFNYYPMRGVATKSYFPNYVSIGKGKL